MENVIEMINGSRDCCIDFLLGIGQWINGVSAGSGGFDSLC